MKTVAGIGGLLCVWILVAGAAGMFAATAAHADVNDYNITADTYIDSRNTTSNYSTSGVDKVVVNASNPTQPCRTLFMLPPQVWATPNITDAQVVFPFYGGSGTLDVRLAPLTPAFTLSGATWQTYDGTNSWTTPGGDYDPVNLAGTYDADYTQYTWDITSLLNNPQDKAELEDYGTILKMFDESTVPAKMEKATFDSSRGVYTPGPFVVITTATPEPATSVMLLAGGALIAVVTLLRRRRSLAAAG